MHISRSRAVSIWLACEVLNRFIFSSVAVDVPRVNPESRISGLWVIHTSVPSGPKHSGSTLFPPPAVMVSLSPAKVEKVPA